MNRKHESPAIPKWGWYVIGSTIFIISIIFLSLSGAFAAAAEFTIHILAAVLPYLLFVLLALLYFIPFFIAASTPRSVAIFVANLVFGWTIIGWILVRNQI
jgi:hypothetical protein